MEDFTLEELRAILEAAANKTGLEKETLNKLQDCIERKAEHLTINVAHFVHESITNLIKTVATAPDFNDVSDDELAIEVKELLRQNANDDDLYGLKRICALISDQRTYVR